MVKNKWTKGRFSTGLKKTAVVPCAVFLSVVGFNVFSLFRMGVSHFRIGTLPIFIEPDLELYDE